MKISDMNISVFPFVFFFFFIKRARASCGIWFKFSNHFIFLLNSIFFFFSPCILCSAPPHLLFLGPFLWPLHQVSSFLPPPTFSLCIFCITPKGTEGVCHTQLSHPHHAVVTLSFCWQRRSSPGAALPPAGAGSAVGDRLLRAKAKSWVRLQNSVACHFHVPISDSQRNAASYIEPGNC